MIGNRLVRIVRTYNMGVNLGLINTILRFGLMDEIDIKISKSELDSLRKELAHMIATVSWVGRSTVIVIVNVLIFNYSGKFDMVELFGIE